MWIVTPTCIWICDQEDSKDVSIFIYQSKKVAGKQSKNSANISVEDVQCTNNDGASVLLPLF